MKNIKNIIIRGSNNRSSKADFDVEIVGSMNLQWSGI